VSNTHKIELEEKDCLQMSLWIAVEQQKGRAAPSTMSFTKFTAHDIQVDDGIVILCRKRQHEDLEVGAERQ
jgi:hypothetical protein